MRTAIGGISVFVVLLCAAFLWPRGGDPTHQPGVRYLNEEGIPVTANDMPREALTRLSLSTPILTLNVPEEEERQLFGVYNGFEYPKGFVIASTRSGDVHFFDREGDLRFVVGGDGDGPGEYRFITQVSPYQADSILVYDAKLGRVTILDKIGALGRTTPIRGDERGTRPRTVWALPDGGIIALVAGHDPDPPMGYHRSRAFILRYGPSGSLKSEVAEIGGFDYLYSPIKEYVGLGPRQPIEFPVFQRRPLVTVSEGRVYAGHDLGFGFDQFTVDGALKRSARWSMADVQLTQQEIDETFRMLLRRAGMEGPVPDYDLIPDPAPASSLILATPEGELWASEYVPGLRNPIPQIWWVFSADGQLLHEVDVGPKTRVLAVSEGRVLGVRLDAFDVETVHVFAIEDRAGS